MKFSTEFKAGALIVIGLFITIWGLNFLREKNLFSIKDRVFYTYFQNINGLKESSIVTVNGLKVGKVTEIVFSDEEDKKGMLKVNFQINKDIVFSKESIVKLYSVSFVGGKGLAIVPTYNGEEAQDGDFIKGEIESDFISEFSESMSPIQKRLEKVLVNTDKLLGSFIKILNQKNTNSISSSINDLNISTKNTRELSDNTKLFWQKNEIYLSSSIRNIDSTFKKLNHIVTQLEKAEINKTINKVDTVMALLSKIGNKVNSNNNTIGRLINSDTLHKQLDKTLVELELLLIDLKKNPSRYVNFSIFGGADTPYIKSKKPSK